MSFSEESEKDGEREKNFSFLYTLTLKSEVIGFFFFISLHKISILNLPVNLYVLNLESGKHKFEFF